MTVDAQEGGTIARLDTNALEGARKATRTICKLRIRESLVSANDRSFVRKLLFRISQEPYWCERDIHGKLENCIDVHQGLYQGTTSSRAEPRPCVYALSGWVFVATARTTEAKAEIDVAHIDTTRTPLKVVPHTNLFFVRPRLPSAKDIIYAATNSWHPTAHA